MKICLELLQWARFEPVTSWSRSRRCNFLSEKILDWGSQLHGATSLHWCNWPSGPI